MYANHGFVRDGEEFLDDGIPHVPMVRQRRSATPRIRAAVTPNLPVQRDRRPRPAAAGAAAVRGATRDRRRADPRREGHREVDRRARPGPRTGCGWSRRGGDIGRSRGHFGRAAHRRHRGPGGRLAGPAEGAARRRARVLAGPAGPRTRRRACTSTRSTCCTTTWSTCSSTPPRWAGVHVERDGVSHSHEARFVLIGTMNPEEGELRPQLLDRFGLDCRRARLPRRRRPRRRDPAADGVRSRSRRVRRSICRTRMPSWRVASPRRAHQSAIVIACRTTSYGASRRCARLSTSTACGPIWWWHAPPSRTPRGGADAAVSGGGHSGGRRTRAAAPAPPRPVRRPGARPEHCSTRRWHQAGNPPTSRSRTRTRSARRRRTGVG